MTTKPLFYPLTTDQLIADLSVKLSNAQRCVYAYWRTLDPKAYRIIPICTQAIAKALGLTRRTVQIALNKLSKKNLIHWDKQHGLISKFVDRQGEQMIAEANDRSPRRTNDRQQPLEVNQSKESEGHKINNINKINKINKNADQISEDQAIAEIQKAMGDEPDQLDEDFDDVEADQDEDDKSLPETPKAPTENDVHLAVLDDDQISEDQAIAEIQKAMGDEPDQLDEDFDDVEADQDEDDKSLPETPKAPTEVESFRRRVEDFVLKTLNKNFNAAQRAAYFSKFDSKSWEKWETAYKASLILPAPYKPYIPEKVEVAAPDSPVVQSAIAQIKAKLGIKS